MKTVPPLNDLFNMAGLNLPTYLKGEDKVEKNNANDKEEPTENSIV
jgi:flotillin